MLRGLGADMWAAALSVHFQHSRGFVRGEEKIYLSKPWRRSPLPCATMEFLARPAAMCEHCHVRRKWLMVALPDRYITGLDCLALCHSHSHLEARMNNLQDRNTLSRQLHSGTVFIYCLLDPKPGPVRQTAARDLSETVESLSFFCHFWDKITNFF